MIRPCSTAPTIVAKLSSVRTMSAASLATSVPLIPMAMPMSACFSAGASLTPSPVMATTSPRRLERLDDPQLVLRARRGRRRRPRRRRVRQPSSSRPSSSRACTVRSGWPRASRSRPSWRPISAAVAGWSPVIIDGADARLAGRWRWPPWPPRGAGRSSRPARRRRSRGPGPPRVARRAGRGRPGPGRAGRAAASSSLSADDPLGGPRRQRPDALARRVEPGSASSTAAPAPP